MLLPRHFNFFKCQDVAHIFPVPAMCFWFSLSPYNNVSLFYKASFIPAFKTLLKTVLMVVF